MIPEIGHFLLWLALGVSIVMGTLPLVGAARGNRAWMAIVRPCAYTLLVLVGLAFVCLAASFVMHDFSVLNVASNSNSALPLPYRIAASWGSHEGSHAAVGADAQRLDGRRRPIQPGTAAAGGGAHPGRDGLGQRGLPAVHAVDLEPVRSPVPGRRPTAAT